MIKRFMFLVLALMIVPAAFAQNVSNQYKHINNV